MVESASDAILAGADNSDVAFLVVGDPFGYGSHALSNIHTAILINDCTEPPPTLTSSSELENFRSRYKASTMLL